MEYKKPREGMLVRFRDVQSIYLVRKFKELRVGPDVVCMVTAIPPNSSSDFIALLHKGDIWYLYTYNNDNDLCDWDVLLEDVTPP